MSRTRIPVCLILIGALVLALVSVLIPVGKAQAAGEDYYVDAVNGEDLISHGSMPGTYAFKTIRYALINVPGGDPGNPNIIHVAAGTYDTGIGESFPLSFNRDDVTLQADSGAVVNGGGAATIFEINAEGITIDGFEITNGYYGVSSDFGGFSLLDNTFTEVTYGVCYDVAESDITGGYAIDDVTITGNSFDASTIGVYFRANLSFNNGVTGQVCDIGDIEISGNYFDGGQYGLRFFGEIAGLTDSTVTVGDVFLNDNDFTGVSQEEIYVYAYGFQELAGDTTVDCGDLEINGNTIYGGDGIYVYWEDAGYDLAGSVSVTVGDNYINGNYITSDGDGIYLYYYCNGYQMAGSSSVTLGELHIEENTINSKNDAVRFLFEYTASDMLENSSFAMGDIFIADNYIDSGGFGIDIDYDEYYMGRNLTGNAQATLPEWNITGNDFETYYSSIDFYTYGNPAYLENNAVVDFGGFYIDDNTFDSEEDGISLVYDDTGYTNSGYSSCAIGDITITDNAFNYVEYDAVYLYFGELGYQLTDYAELTLGDITVTGNTVSGNYNGYGIYVMYEEGAETYLNSSLETGALVISGNGFSDVENKAVFIEYYFSNMQVDDNTSQVFGDIDISDNVIDYCGDGILVEYYMDVSGSSPDTATFGELDITGNELNNIVSDDGIDVEYGLYTHDAVTLNVGRALIRGNVVSDCVSSALDFDMYVYEWGTSTINLGDPEIDENIFRDSAEGIYLWGVRNASVTGNEIMNNEGGGLCGVYIEDSYDWLGWGDDDSFPAMNNVFRCNNITGNIPYGMDNLGTGIADAEENWWGDESGPSGVGPGSGDAVSTNVDFEPWLEAPCGEIVCGDLSVSITPSVTMGEAPLTVQFYGYASNSVTDWDWSFGTGETSTSRSPACIFQNEGTYTVILRVTDECEQTASATVTIQVEGSGATSIPNLVVTSLNVAPAYVYAGQPVQVTATVNNYGGSWGSGNLLLLVNGYLEQQDGVGLAAGSSETAGFTVYRTEPGEYQVTLGDASATFYVMETAGSSTQDSGPFSGGPLDTGGIIAIICIGVILLGGIILVFLFARR